MAFRSFSRKSRAGFAFLALALVLLLAYALILAPRTKKYNYRTEHITTPCLEVLNGQEHWAKPLCEGESSIGDRSARIRFNSEGLRDKEYPSKPPKGVIRILFFGSSNVLGLGLEENQTMPRRLEYALRAKGLKVEVINAAMVGYCTIQTSLRFQKLIERYSPRIVLYNFVQGSCPLFDGAWHSRTIWTNGAPTYIDRSLIPGFHRLNNFFFSRPQLFFIWLTAADQLKKALFTWKVYFAGGADQRAKEFLAPSIPYFNYMKTVSEKAGAEFFTVAYLMGKVMQAIPAQFNPAVTNLLSGLAAPLDEPRMQLWQELSIGGFQPLFSRTSLAPQTVPGDEHFTAEGAELFAVFLADQLAEKLVPLAR